MGQLGLAPARVGDVSAACDGGERAAKSCLPTNEERLELSPREDLGEVEGVVDYRASEEVEPVLRLRQGVDEVSNANELCEFTACAVLAHQPVLHEGIVTYGVA